MTEVSRATLLTISRRSRRFIRQLAIGLPSPPLSPCPRSKESPAPWRKNSLPSPRSRTHISAPLLALNAAVRVAEKYPSLTFTDIFGKRRCNLLWERSYGHEHQSHS